MYICALKPLSFELTFIARFQNILRTFGPKTIFLNQISFQIFDNQGSTLISTLKKNVKTKFTKHNGPNL